MFQRVVCLTTIAAVIACPLWCSSGSCADSHCSEQHCAVSSAGEQSSDLPACCRETLPAQQDQEPVPCGCPDKAFCQGVCGGAVLEEPVELNDVSLSFFFCQNETGQAIEPQLPASQSIEASYHWHCHGGNYGRSLRTLHMSFLL